MKIIEKIKSFFKKTTEKSILKAIRKPTKDNPDNSIFRKLTPDTFSPLEYIDDITKLKQFPKTEKFVYLQDQEFIPLKHNWISTPSGENPFRDTYTNAKIKDKKVSLKEMEEITEEEIAKIKKKVTARLKKEYMEKVSAFTASIDLKESDKADKGITDLRLEQALRALYPLKS